MGEVESGTPCKDIKKENKWGKYIIMILQNKTTEGLYKMNAIFKVLVFVKKEFFLYFFI